MLVINFKFKFNNCDYHLVSLNLIKNYRIMYTFQKMFHMGQKNMEFVDQILCMLEDTHLNLGNADI